MMSDENHPSQFTLRELVVYVSLVGISMSILASLELFAGVLGPRLEVVAGQVTRNRKRPGNPYRHPSDRLLAVSPGRG
jgi:hypothetical protein